MAWMNTQSKLVSGDDCTFGYYLQIVMEILARFCQMLVLLQNNKLRNMENSVKDVSDKKMPQGNDLTAKDEHYRYHMHEVLDQIRGGCPYKDETFNRWIVTDLKEAKKLFTSDACGRDWEVSSEGTWGDVVTSRDGKFGMVDSDGEEHRRLRGPLEESFSRKNIEKLKPRLDAIADELIENLKGKKTFDFIAEIAAPLPTLVMAEILGVDKEDQEDFKNWSDEWVYICDPDLSADDAKRASDASMALTRYFDKAVDERMANPKDDLISKIIHESGENMLSKDEIVTICLQLIVAGNITSADLIGNGMVALLKDPQQMDLLRNNMDMIKDAAEEMLRYDPPVTEIPRFLSKDVEVSGCPISKGQTLTMNLAGVNHDPNVYENPHEFDITRKGPSHLAFGGGAHHCLGIHLARMEIQTTFQKILEAFPVLKLVDQDLERKSIPTFSGYKKILVTTE